MQDNGPGIVKKQIPLIFGKLLYGSKFHRLRMSRGQQGIGISAAGMYGMLTTGKPVKIISKLSPKRSRRITSSCRSTRSGISRRSSTAREKALIFRPGKKAGSRSASTALTGTHYPTLRSHAEEAASLGEVKSGTRVTIELEGRFIRGRGSVDEYLEQTAIANPHVTLHYKDPEGNETSVQAVDDAASAGAEGDQAASVWDRAGPAGDDAEGHARRDDVGVF